MAGDGGALSAILTYAGWAFLPNFATSLLQSLFYNLTIPTGSARPQLGQPIYLYHRRRIHIFVLSLYLLYTFTQTLYDIRLAGDFYTVLGVSPTSPDREIKAKFRRLAARFHPDKIRAGNDGPPPSASSDATFVHLKLAHDTVLDPARRFAYDRFGQSVVQVEQPGLKTIRDYVYAGLRSLIPEYVKGAVMLVALNQFWLPKWGQFWRYLAILTLAFLELYFLTHEWNPTTATAAPEPAPAAQLASTLTALARNLAPEIIPDHLLPFQILTLARRMSISLNIFISQLAPSPTALSPHPTDNNNNNNSQAADLHTQTIHLSQLNNLAAKTDAEATALLNLGLAPFRGEPPHVETLRRRMREGMVTTAIRNHPQVRDAVARVLERGGEKRVEGDLFTLPYSGRGR